MLTIRLLLTVLCLNITSKKGAVSQTVTPTFISSLDYSSFCQPRSNEFSLMSLFKNVRAVIILLWSSTSQMNYKNLLQVLQNESNATEFSPNKNYMYTL